MTATRTTQRHADIQVAPATLRRLGWVAVACVTGWMSGTCVAILAWFAGIAADSQVTAVMAVATALAAALLYVRFRRIGRLDETLVISIVVAWAATIGIFSL